MRLLPVIFMLAVLGFCTLIMFSGITSGTAADKALLFLKAVKAGDKQAAIDCFGDNSCNCAPASGFEGYLRYNRGNEPNVAFLLGQPFATSQPSSVPTPVKQQSYTMPWEKTEEALVEIPITYEDANSRPYFLPLDMAFGYEMSQKDLDAFADNPEKGWLRGFTMRLRNGLGRGVIEPDPPIKDNIEELRRKAFEKDLPAAVLRYIKPADAGEVKLASGQVVTAGSIAADLPRLNSVVIGMKMVRRGAMYPWSVKKVGIQEAVVGSKNKEFVLKEPSEKP